MPVCRAGFFWQSWITLEEAVRNWRPHSGSCLILVDFWRYMDAGIMWCLVILMKESVSKLASFVASRMNSSHMNLPACCSVAGANPLPKVAFFGTLEACFVTVGA